METCTEQDYYEFETILGEIPNVTSGSRYSEESVLPNSSLNLEALGMEKERRNSFSPASFNKFSSALPTGCVENRTALCDFSSLGRSDMACLSSPKHPFDCQNQTNCNLDGVNVFLENENVSSIEIADGENFYLPECKSLTSAFRQLSFMDRVAIQKMNSQPINHRTSPNLSFIQEHQQRNNLVKPLSKLDSGSMSISSPQSIINPSSNSIETLNMVSGGQENVKFLKLGTQELKKQKPWSFQSLEKLPGEFFEKGQYLPLYSETMPLASGTNPFHVIPSIHDNGTELPVGPYQWQCFLETHSDVPFVQPQHICQSDVELKYTEEDWYWQKTQQQYLHLQQQWNEGPETHSITQANAEVTLEPLTRNATQPYFEMPISQQLEQINKDLFCNSASVWRRGIKPSELTLTGNVLCHCYAQGSCGRGKSCPFAQGQKQISAGSFDTSSITYLRENAKVGKFSFPEKILTRPQGLNSPKTMKPAFAEVNESCNHASINGDMFFDDHFHHHSTFKAGVSQSDLQKTLQAFPLDGNIIGRVYAMAKDQYGCRFLQKKLTERNAEDIEKIFIEIISHIVELMVDPFGNYLVQKLVEVCNEVQRMKILHAISGKPGDLVRTSLDVHGTRAVQKIIETINTPEEFSMVISSLKPGILILMKDSNGSHVAQRCLQYSMPQFQKFIFEAAIVHCVELGTDRHGCCVLQKCLSHSDGEQRHHLVDKIALNALILSQDQFGNYVVQCVFKLQIPWAAAVIINQLEGNYEPLSMQKYSSNVVERCLKYAGEARCSRIIHELIDSSQFDQILQDPYGNYVIQAALNHSKGATHAALVEAIRPHTPALRTSPYGKNVLSNKSLKK